MIKLSLIILNWNGRDHLARCLESIKAQIGGSDEVIVVDNASVDDSLEVAARIYPQSVIIRLESNAAFCAPNNLAARRARGDYLVFMNNDIVIGPDFFKHMEHAIRTYSPDLLALRILQLRKPGAIDNCGIYFNCFGSGRHRFRGRSADAEEAMSPESGILPMGACFVVRRDVFLELGGFDEALFINHEDLDLSLRAVARGFHCVYVPFPTVFHYGSATVEVDNPSEWIYYYIQRNMEVVFAKDLTAGAIVVCALPHAAYLMFQLYKAVRKSRVRLFFRAKIDALKMLAKARASTPCRLTCLQILRMSLSGGLTKHTGS